MELENVLKEKVPYHARIYPFYLPVMGTNFKTGEEILYNEDLQKEIDDLSEDEDKNYGNDGRNQCHYEEVPIAKIKRAHKINGEEKEFAMLERLSGKIVDQSLYRYTIDLREDIIRRNGRDINFFKLFHIWNIRLDKKPNYLPWSARFQPLTNEIELEIHNREKSGNGTSQNKIINFMLDTQVCDRRLFATVDNCKVKYSLLSNATRVKFEIRTYNYDGSPARNVEGHIRAYFRFREGYEIYLFGGHNKCEKSEHMAASDTLTLCPSVLILPRDHCPLKLDMSLENNSGEFMIKKEVVLILRTIAVDEPHYIVGEKGYILLKAIWACLCVDLDQGVCTCPGTAMGTFQARKNSGKI